MHVQVFSFSFLVTAQANLYSFFICITGTETGKTKYGSKMTAQSSKLELF